MSGLDNVIIQLFPLEAQNENWWGGNPCLNFTITVVNHFTQVSEILDTNRPLGRSEW